MMTLILAFLLGFTAAVAVAAVTVIVVGTLLTVRYLINFVRKILKGRKNHKIVFADTITMCDDSKKNDESVKEMVKNASEISMEELEKMCEEHRYVSAVVDEDGNLSDYMEFQEVNNVDESLTKRLEQNGGLILIGA